MWMPGRLDDRPDPFEWKRMIRVNGLWSVIGFITISVWIMSLSGEYAMAADGLRTVPSEHDAKQSVDRLVAEIEAKGMTVFARVDHAAGAAAEGIPLRPTELVIFGNAKAGTPLMQADQAIGIDLPLKALVYQDAQRIVWLSYNDPMWLVRRHGLGAALDPIANAMAGALHAVATKATKKP